MIKKTLCSLLITALLATTVTLTKAQPILDLSVKTNTLNYPLGGIVTVSGNLTYYGNPVPDGLVALQVDDPESDLLVIRTLTTGDFATGPWLIEVLSVTPTDQAGNPKSTFLRGTTAYFNVTMRNNDVLPRYVKVGLNIYDSGKVPFHASYPQSGQTPPGPFSVRVSAFIPANVPTGTATVHASAFSAEPEIGGYSYSPEKSATFLITTTATASTASADGSTYQATENGTYIMSFRLPYIRGKLGVYTVYASTMYEAINDTGISSFQTFLEGDLNDDKKVDMRDIGIAARAYGSEPGDPLWDPVADINRDLVVDMRDIGAIARNFGFSAA